jgi:hypothetical protein
VDRIQEHCSRGSGHRRNPTGTDARHASSVAAAIQPQPQDGLGLQHQRPMGRNTKPRPSHSGVSSYWIASRAPRIVFANDSIAA